MTKREEALVRLEGQYHGAKRVADSVDARKFGFDVGTAAVSLAESAVAVIGAELEDLVTDTLRTERSNSAAYKRAAEIARTVDPTGKKARILESLGQEAS